MDGLKLGLIVGGLDERVSAVEKEIALHRRVIILIVLFLAGTITHVESDALADIIVKVLRSAL